MKKTEEKKTTAAAAAKKKPGRKPGTVKAAAKKTTAKTVAKNPAAKRPGRKPKPITIETVCKLIEKKIVKANVSKVKGTVAADIEVWGFEDGSNQKMYIEVKDGKASVMPHTYNAKDFRVSLSFANAMDFANGKITLAKLIDSEDFYAEGNIAAAVKMASIF